MGLEYGKCPCTGTYEKRSVEVRMTVDKKLIQLNDIPQGACPSCGSRIYKASILECIESIMKQSRIIIRLD